MSRFPVALTRCFWCGEGNEIVIGKRLMDDHKAEKFEAEFHNKALTYEPCPKCKDGMESGITLIEASAFPVQDGQPPIQNGVYPTGRFIVVREEAISRIFDPSIAQQCVKARKAFLDIESFDILISEIKEGDSE